MKFDSIKSRLVLMTLICVIGMSMLVGSQHYFTQRLIELNQQRDLLLRMGQDLLQMRRHEKDFLLRYEQVYFDKFNNRAEVFSERLNALSMHTRQYNFSQDNTDDLAVSLSEYQTLFNQVVMLQGTIGLDQNTGLIGQIKETEQRIAQMAEFSVNSQNYERFVSVRLALSDFLLTKDTYFSSKASQELAAVLASLSSSSPSNVLQVATAYNNTLGALIASTQSMGLTHNDGLRGRFRRQAHLVESQLSDIDKALQPMIEAQESRVQLYSVSIAVLTSVVLILVLIKSFATFHRAFANFVMFFYRCKRQYQRIDPKKLGFAEFKSLAELANEMVESRKDIEERLASVEAELARTSQQQKPSSVN
ncbi:chemotaxis protein [Alteromonas sp. KUL49]|uniref:chemotaxis protein n=1 Tax=Alteromonas sp. KUL49 TaxID=2480798 RepID=UPI00102EF55F|nr:chemotaxis protein [Alteromonas sp. KUL49]TAP33884.1 chemotaxis protein [Alteromonas sp. KUL49]GEA13645.1 hypothetical protein KUL49_40200 [Alteromonas sp. KUL49]